MSQVNNDRHFVLHAEVLYRTVLNILYDRASAVATLANRVEPTQRYEGRNGISTCTLLVLKESTYSRRLKLISRAEFLEWP